MFRRGYGREAIPFPAVSSYAMQFDQSYYDTYIMARIVDTHWTEKDVEDYKAYLKSKGFEETTGEMPRGTVPVFTKLLREDYKAYSMLYVGYENGLVIEGRRYNETTMYKGQAAISEAVQKHGFAALPETDIFGEWEGEDMATVRSEDWGYRFDYNLYLAFHLYYEDREAAEAYMEDYMNKLLASGFEEVYNPGASNRSCMTPNESVELVYEFSPAEEDTGELTVWFKELKHLTTEETIAALKEHGLPETDIHGDVSAKDMSKYQYEDIGFEGLFVSVYQYYKTIEDAEKYLDEYVPGLEDQGYYSISPDRFNSQRRFLYYNEDLRKYVAFDVYEGAKGGTIYYEFVSFEYDDSSSIMMKALRR